MSAEVASISAEDKLKGSKKKASKPEKKAKPEKSARQKKKEVGQWQHVARLHLTSLFWQESEAMTDD